MSEEIRKRVLEEKFKSSSKISELCRYIGFGLAAVSFSILTSTSPYSIQLVKEYKPPLICSSIIGILVILLDYLQFLAKYICTNKALQNKAKDYQYSDEWLLYKALHWCFNYKQILALLGALILIVTIFISI
jgi:hypothetical protein